jgi:hypothetical protein
MHLFPETFQFKSGERAPRENSGREPARIMHFEKRREERERHLPE